MLTITTTSLNQELQVEKTQQRTAMVSLKGILIHLWVLIRSRRKMALFTGFSKSEILGDLMGHTALIGMTKILDGMKKTLQLKSVS